MRKRAQMRSKPISYEPIPKHIVQKPIIEKRRPISTKNWLIALSLICIFVLVLFLNTYFNITVGDVQNPTGEGLDKYYLSGPDPYYNMRLVDDTLYGSDKGHYPYYSELDPLLNYPFGRSGSRAPLLNMMAIGFSRFLTPFMDEIDAIGLSMQFIPALFGALLIFPVYFIGKTVHSRTAGLIAALFVAIIPIHLGSGHGSAFTLFDHDSFNLLLFFLTFLFLIKSVKEKDTIKSVLYALLGGVSLAALSMTWVEDQFLYAVIAVYALVQMFIDIITSKINKQTFISTVVLLLSGFLISLPVRLSEQGGYTADIPLYLCLAVGFFGVIYLFFGKKRMPWTLSIPSIFIVLVVGLVFLYFIDEISQFVPAFSSLNRLSEIIFGSGIYGQEVSLTIAEANTYGISRTVMSFGPALYWMGWIGLLFIGWFYLKDKERRDYLFLFVLFIIDIWLTSIAGRFINDMVPIIAVLGGITTCIMLTKINYGKMIKDIRSIGFSFHGLKRGIKITHIFGILFIGFLIILPQTYMAFDVSVPYKDNTKYEIMEGFQTAGYGLSLYTEQYWVDALDWLSEQDLYDKNGEPIDPVDRPAVISWWDYGFYEVAVAKHPTVADNFQDGIPPAANFHTSTSEQEAISVWIVRLIEGSKRDNNGRISEEIEEVISRYFGNESTNLINIINEPSKYAPSYNMLVNDGDYKNEDLRESSENALYHDSVDIITKTLNDEEIIWFYKEIQDATGLSIRYYMVEGYDINIYNVFTFLADKGTYGYETDEDDYFVLWYEYPDPDNGFQTTRANTTEISKLPQDVMTLIQQAGGFNPVLERKDLWYDSMVYKCYLGPIPREIFDEYEYSAQDLLNSGFYAPTGGLKHFAVKYLNPSFYYLRAGANSCLGCPAVIISKYYAGAYINGSITSDENPLSNVKIVVLDEFGISHDYMMTGEDGQYSIIVPGGNITLQVQRNIELSTLGIPPFVMKEITFDGDSNSTFAPITDDEAMRQSDVFSRQINISVGLGSISGYMYVDKDNNGEYNKTTDDVVSGAKISFYEVNEFNTTSGLVENYGDLKQYTTDENGFYNITDITPGWYVVQVVKDDYKLYESLTRIYSGENSYNMSKSKESTVEGYVFYDEDEDGKFDDGEEIADADIEIKYEDSKTITTIKSDINGYYKTTDLPTYNQATNYAIYVTKYNDVTNRLEYETIESLSIEANDTITYNISIGLSPVTVSGNTKSDTKTLQNVEIEFNKDKSVENNKASSTDAESDEAGAYSVDLIPGTYNVSATTKINESGVNVTYSYEGKLTVSIGEETKSFDILMVKEET